MTTGQRTLSVLAVCLLFSAAAVKGDWESDANTRIEQIRKRDAQITVVDSNGQPVSGLSAQIEQVGHRFAFGTCIAYSPLSTSAEYRNFILNHFEWAVCENETKWGSNEPSQDFETYYNADYIYNWCNSNGIKMRGHCLFWEQVNSNFPSWVQDLSYATYPASSDLLTEVDERLNSAVNHFRNKFYNWDVDNEMLTDDFFTSRLGDGGIVHMFNAAKAIAPECGMFMNEYSGNSFGSYNSYGYAFRANNLISMGATIDGLGIQGHVNSPFNPEYYWSYVLEPLRTIVGLPLWVTEFDVETSSTGQRATDLENFYRICFSHPSVEGIIMWGFWAGSQWRDNAQLVENDWTINAAGLRYESLLNEWTTSEARYTDLSGNANFRGFHGTYEITLSAPGQTTEVHQIELEPGTGTAQFTLLTDLVSPEPDNTPPAPDPPVWAAAPAATGPVSITMTAVTADDNTPPVQYYFECTNFGDASSGWQTSPTYTAQGLSLSTQYTFRVKARDSAIWDGEIVPNETGWSQTASATTPPPGTEVEILGTWQTGTSRAKEYGYNRALVFIAQAEYGTTTLDSVTYGGQPMTRVVDIDAGTNVKVYASAFILDEAGIAAATSDTFVPSWSATPTYVAYTSAFLGNVDQTALVGASDSNGTSTDTPNPIRTNPLATNDRDMVIVAATCGNVGSYTLEAGFTEGIDQQIGSPANATGVIGYKPATGANETLGADYSGTVNRQVIIGFVINAQEPPVYSNCGEVIAAGRRLSADIAGAGDCYVDYYDLDTFVDYWLNETCTGPDNCHGADFEPADGVVDLFDFSDFANQWLTCNDPEGIGCTPNW